MPESDERTLLRSLTGELGPKEQANLERRLGAEPRLARRYRRLQAAWEVLDLPEPDPAPTGFSARVASALEPQRPARSLGWGALVGTARWAATVALVAGLVTGFGLFSERPAPSEPGEHVGGDEWSGWEASPTLAAGYWRAIEALEEQGFEEEPR